MATMKAVRILEKQEVICDKVLVPEIVKGKVLVKMHMASICGTDLHYVYDGWPRNNYPMEPGEPGHEGIGTIVDPGGSGFAEGDLVLTVPNIWQARNFADFQAISPEFLIKLESDKPPEQLMMAQQLGTVIFASRKLPDINGKSVVILGQGSAGIFHTYYLQALGASTISIVEPNQARRNAGVAMGANHAIDRTGRGAVEAVADLTNGKGVDLVIDAVGGHDTLNQAIEMVRPEGYVHVFGLPGSSELSPFDLGSFVLKHLDMGTLFGAQDEPGLASFKEALRLINEGLIDMAPFVTHIFPIEKTREAFDLAKNPTDGALKVSLRMEHV